MTDPRVTEQQNPRTKSIDLASPLEIVDLINAEDQTVAAAVATQRKQIARAIEAAETAFRSGGRLLYVGAGTSGRLGVLDASECPPTFGSNPRMVQGIIAGGISALTKAIEGAEDSPEKGAAAMDWAEVVAKDFIVGIAASGTTPFVKGALQRANEIGSKTALIACTPVSKQFLDLVNIAIIPIVGPEVVTGSTRMKAGTATKLVLNTITTGAMIRLGKTYGNLMVDLKPKNNKLKDRSERIVVEICGITREQARSLLESAGHNVKTAIVMHKLVLSRKDAEAALVNVRGVIRRLLDDPDS